MNQKPPASSSARSHRDRGRGAAFAVVQSFAQLLADELVHGIRHEGFDMLAPGDQVLQEL